MLLVEKSEISFKSGNNREKSSKIIDNIIRDLISEDLRPPRKNSFKKIQKNSSGNNGRKIECSTFKTNGNGTNLYRYFTSTKANKMLKKLISKKGRNELNKIDLSPKIRIEIIAHRSIVY